VEDTSHIITCPLCDKRKKVRTDYIKTLQYKMINMGTNTTTVRVIIHHLPSWLNQTPALVLQEIAPEASEHLKQAVISQTDIGWDQWFRGRISILWGELYNYDKDHSNIPLYNPSASKWGKSVIEETWKFILESWEIRNTIEHDSDGNPQLRLKEKLCRKIKWIEQQITQPHEYEDISMDELLKLPEANLEIMVDQIAIIWKKSRTQS
jgi:hypothetical protein